MKPPPPPPSQSPTFKVAMLQKAPPASDPRALLAWLCSNAPMFEFVGEETAKLLFAVATVKDFGANVIMLREGERASHLHVLLDGSVAIRARTERGSLEIATFGVGDVVAEFAMLENAVAPMSFVAIEPTRVLAIDARQMAMYCAAFHPAATRFLDAMCVLFARRLAEYEERVAKLTSRWAAVKGEHDEP